MLPMIRRLWICLALLAFGSVPGGCARASAPEPSPRSPGPVLEAPREGEEVHLSCADPAVPLGGAIVVWIDAAERERMRASRAELDLTDLDALVQAAGRRYRADARGIVRVPRNASGATLIASVGGTWGERDLPPSSFRRTRPARLELEPDRALVVRVVDAAGRPQADVPVAVRWRRGLPGAVEDGGLGSYEAWRGTTSGPAGEASIPHAQRFHARAEDDANGSASTCALRLRLPLEPPVEFELGTELPDGPVTLVLPPTGRVIVQLPRESVPATLGLLTPAQQRRRQADFHYHWDEVQATAPQHVFEHVGLGLELVAVARWDGLAAELARPIHGPERAGQEVIGRIEANDEPVFSGSVVDEDGRAVEHERLSASIWCTGEGGGGSIGLALQTRVGGAFQFTLPRNSSDSAQIPRALRARLAGAGREPGSGSIQLVIERLQDGEPSARAMVELGPELDLPRTELGQLVLSKPPMIASGVVVDERGEPVPDARVQLQEALPIEPAANVPPTWIDAPGEERSAFADASGRFELRYWLGRDPRPGVRIAPSSAASRERLRLYATAEGRHADTPVEFERGASALRVLARAGGTVRGSLRIDAGLDPAELDVRLEAAPRPRGPEDPSSGPALVYGQRLPARDPGYAPPRTRTGPPDDNPLRGCGSLVRGTDRLEFEWKGAVPGEARVVVECVGVQEPLLVVEPIAVRAAELTLDPRLQEVDLRGARQCVTLDVLGPDGTPLETATASIEPAGTDLSATRAVTGRGGRIEICTRRRPLELSVRAPGCQTAHLRAVQSDQRVQLRRAPRVRLVLADATCLPGPPYALGARFTRESPSEEYGGADRFGADAALLRALPEPGRWRVDWAVQRIVDPLAPGSADSERLGGSPAQRWDIGPGEDLEIGLSARIDVRETDEPQEFRVAPPAEALRAAMDRLPR